MVTRITSGSIYKALTNCLISDARNVSIARVAWADIAKAISIILLVLWHTNGFHAKLSFVRMPLFFFVSGLFAYRVIVSASLRDFVNNKVLNMLYLYVLWAAVTFAAEWIAAGGEKPISLYVRSWLSVFWNPPRTLWFIYALAVSFVLARILRRAPFGLVLFGALAAFSIARLSIGPEWTSFVDRIAWLFPFFWVGLFSLPASTALVERHQALWPVFAVLYVALAFMVADREMPGFHAAYLMTSCIGIVAISLFARRIAPSRVGRALTAVGRATIYIYLMHRIALIAFEWFFEGTTLSFPGLSMLIVAVIVAGCMYLGRWLNRTKYLSWLVRAPWVHARN